MFINRQQRDSLLQADGTSPSAIRKRKKSASQARAKEILMKKCRFRRHEKYKAVAASLVGSL
jgi:hypothetical protein